MGKRRIEKPLHLDRNLISRIKTPPISVYHCAELLERCPAVPKNVSGGD